MSRKSKTIGSKKPPTGEQLMLWSDAAVLAGLEPILEYDPTPKKKRHPSKSKAFRLKKWAHPFLRPDGLIWTYVGHGEWEAHAPTYYRTKYQFEWLQNKFHYEGERKRLIEWLDIKRHQEMREKQNG